jgi:hypothetical protein
MRRVNSPLMVPDFFARLRDAVGRLGLIGEEIPAVGVYFAAMSRFSRNPLRLSVEERTQGSAIYIARRVARLISPEDFLELSIHDSDAWTRFKNSPAHKLVFLMDGDGPCEPGSVRFEVSPVGISRIVPKMKEGRIFERTDAVEAPIACISVHHEPTVLYEPRWLTMRLNDSPENPAMHRPLSDSEIEQWQGVDEIVGTRVGRGVLLPDWSNLVAELGCRKCGVARHLPAFFQAWQMTAILRSFDRSTTDERPLRATFEDYAATRLLLSKISSEGKGFPSPKEIFLRTHEPGEHTSVLSPATGIGAGYTAKMPKTERPKLF